MTAAISPRTLATRLNGLTAADIATATTVLVAARDDDLRLFAAARGVYEALS